MDGTFFTIQENDDGKITARCTECDELKKGNIFSTGNYINHYKTKHSARVKSMEEYLKAAKQPKGAANTTTNTNTVRQPSIANSFSSSVSGDIVSNEF